MNPTISVIVPVYGVELYIRQCVDSLLAQTFTDLEIILVDDGSPDGCPAICDAYAARDERVRVIHKENGGLSDARNVGIDAARGKYIGFVDSDDWVCPDMYEYLYEGIKNYDADIAVCEYFNVWNKKADAAYRKEPRFFKGSGSLRALLLLKIGNYAWNKLYKRELWTDDIRYPAGQQYEDVRTTYRVFQRTSSVIALPEVKYYYRRRNDSITGRKTVLNEGECVFSRMERFDALDAVTREWPDVRQFMLKEIYDYALAFRTAVCKASAEEFSAQSGLVERISAFLASHSEEICSMKGWGRLGRMSYAYMCQPTQTGWRSSVRVERLTKAKANLTSKLKKRVAPKNAMDELYGTCAALPLNEKLAFVESRGGEDLAGNMLCVTQALAERGMDIVIGMKDGYADKINAVLESVGISEARLATKGSSDYYRAFSEAKYLFNDMVYPEQMVKKDGQVFVNTWHGTPLKMLEYDTTTQRHILGGATRGFMQCNYLCVPCEYLTQKLLEPSSIENLYPGKIIYSGYPRNSIFFNNEKRQSVRESLGISDSEVFAYMPTWRGSLNAHADITGMYAAQSILDFFEATLKENQVMYVKLHNYAASTVYFDGYTHVKPFPQDVDAYTMLNAVDCLITDYSSVFFDYACTGGKVILFTYDLEDYLQDRGLYLDLESLPFPKVSTYDQLAAELNVTKGYEDEEFLATYCTYDCIDATEKIMRVVLEGNDDGVRVENISTNGKRNVLIYDARYYLRNETTEEIEQYLEQLDPAEANYHYGYRQWCLKRTPRYLANLPEGIRPYAFTNTDYATTLERKQLKNSKDGIPSTYAAHEINRLMYGNPFDEIVIVGENDFDPFVPLLKSLPHCRCAE